MAFWFLDDDEENANKKKEKEYCAECGSEIGQYWESTCLGGDTKKFCDDICLCRYNRRK